MTEKMNTTTKRVYKTIWKSSRGDANDVEIWVSVSKIEENWRAHDESYIGTNGIGAAKPGAYASFAAWARSSQPVEMPEVTIYEGKVQFSNGRHRFAFFRDHGMTAMKVQTDPHDIIQFEKMFSTPERQSFWFDGEPLSTWL